MPFLQKASPISREPGHWLGCDGELVRKSLQEEVKTTCAEPMVLENSGVGDSQADGAHRKPCGKR